MREANSFLACLRSEYGFLTLQSVGLQPLQIEESEKPSGKVPEGDPSASRVLQGKQEAHPNFRQC